jgi:hypothetical protein
LLGLDNRPRTRALLRLLAKAAIRTCSVVFYYAVSAIGGKTRLKSRLLVSCYFRGQIDAERWLSILVVHNG